MEVERINLLEKVINNLEIASISMRQSNNTKAAVQIEDSINKLTTLVKVGKEE